MKNRKKIKKEILLSLIVLVVMFAVTTAFAAVSYISVSEKDNVKGSQTTAAISAETSKGSRTRAPEPGTLVLFGGGIAGMVVGFVRKTYAVLKRILDVCFSVAGFIILSPLLLLLALAVKITSKGPIIYSQTRVGKDGELFEIYKLRTMKVDAEKDSGPVWARSNDNRLTPIGKFLRKSHMDELPQFINVLNGEMSIIGPRPERPVFVDQFKKEITGYQGRLEVKPGITGLAQVWHRYDATIEDVKKKLKYDLLYIKKMCLMSDFRIILRTFRVVVTGEGAN